MTFQITVLGLIKETTVIKFDCSKASFDKTTTLELKKKIFVEHLKDPGVDTDSVRLVFDSTAMEDEKTFSDYHIQNMSSVMMISRMLGGRMPQPVP
uniref:Ubiquitin-like domain-containing protein n=1 Tax=Anguilla anguilla TaxID=7936 RepID=A0A0E9WWB5_ANGAN